MWQAGAPIFPGAQVQGYMTVSAEQPHLSAAGGLAVVLEGAALDGHELPLVAR